LVQVDLGGQSVQASYVVIGYFFNFPINRYVDKPPWVSR